MKDKYVIQIYRIIEDDPKNDVVKVQERYEYFTCSTLKDIINAIKGLYGVRETFNYNKWKKNINFSWGDLKNENNDNQSNRI